MFSNPVSERMRAVGPLVRHNAGRESSERPETLATGAPAAGEGDRGCCRAMGAMGQPDSTVNLPER
jgi:hypothetical protein